MLPIVSIKKKIGVFDSGVGGLWVLRYLQKKLPSYDYIFFGDQAHVPYGKRSIREIKNFSEEITKFLINRDCGIIVIACNTASAASLKYLREKFPRIIFVGLEPAIRLAIDLTKTKEIIVLATPATFQGELYKTVVEKFSQGIKIYKNTCLGLVNQIEEGDLNSIKTKNILEKALLPVIKKGIDSVVLGCTHYPFVIPLIRKIVGKKINIIDSTPAIVERVSNILKENNFKSNNDKGLLNIFTSGEASKMEITLFKLFDQDIKVKEVKWDNNRLNISKK